MGSTSMYIQHAQNLVLDIATGTCAMSRRRTESPHSSVEIQMGQSVSGCLVAPWPLRHSVVMSTDPSGRRHTETNPEGDQVDRLDNKTG
eukprot:scaffold16190_cov21-Prasinocladus_malaysianus.AAC.2